MLEKPFTVLEIGSGSFKLHRENDFTMKYQSSLGKGLKQNALNQDSVKIALDNLDNQIIPFLEEKKIKLNEVKVFATAAIRTAMKDPNKSGEDFIKELEKRTFQDIRVFSEEDECLYASLGVLEEIKTKFPEIKSFAMLDTGGASHQLVEIDNLKITQMRSFPIGSHTDLDQVELPKFSQLAFQKQENLVIIGTSGTIITAIAEINLEKLIILNDKFKRLDIESRRHFLEELVLDKEIHKLFVDYRLAILPVAFEIIINCIKELNAVNLIYSSSQAMNYVSKHGFHVD